MLKHSDARSFKRTAQRSIDISRSYAYDGDARSLANIGHNALENFVQVESILKNIIDSSMQ